MSKIDIPDDFDFHRINKFALDDEWELQPKLYRHYAEQVADAERDHRLTETALELVEAEVELAIRKDTVSAGLEKGTEGEIKKAVIVSEKVRQAKRVEINARHKVDVLKAAVRTLEHRKAALEETCRLFLAEYFSRPRAGDVGREMEQRKIDQAFKPRRRANG